MSNYILFMSAVIIGQIGLRISQRNQSIPFQQAGSESWEKHPFKQKETYRNVHSQAPGRVDHLLQLVGVRGKGRGQGNQQTVW